MQQIIDQFEVPDDASIIGILYLYTNATASTFTGSLPNTYASITTVKKVGKRTSITYEPIRSGASVKHCYYDGTNMGSWA